MDFNTATDFVGRVKEHYADNVTVYHQFLDILQTYQRESKPTYEVHDQVRSLFSDSPELQADFEKFLPNA